MKQPSSASIAMFVKRSLLSALVALPALLSGSSARPLDRVMDEHNITSLTDLPNFELVREWFRGNQTALQKRGMTAAQVMGEWFPEQKDMPGFPEFVNFPHLKGFSIPADFPGVGFPGYEAPKVPRAVKRAADVSFSLSNRFSLLWACAFADSQTIGLLR